MLSTLPADYAKFDRRNRVIAVANGVGALLTLAFWGLVFTKLPLPNTLSNASERMNAATTYAFGIADLIWSLPLLLMAAIGLWRRRLWGVLAAYMTNALWCYSLTVIIARDLYSQTLSPGTVIFLPFAFFSIWATIQLWKQHEVSWP